MCTTKYRVSSRRSRRRFAGIERESSLAYTNGATNIAFGTRLPANTERVTMRTEKALNKLCFRHEAPQTPRWSPLANKLCKTYCVLRHDAPQTPRGSALANADAATHSVLSATAPRKHRQGLHSQTQVAQHILCLAPRFLANTEKVAPRKRKWRKTYCVWRDEVAQDMLCLAPRPCCKRRRRKTCCVYAPPLPQTPRRSPPANANGANDLAFGATTAGNVVRAVTSARNFEALAR